VEPPLVELLVWPQPGLCTCPPLLVDEVLLEPEVVEELVVEWPQPL
jgi:hypothetical protein